MDTKEDFIAQYLGGTECRSQEQYVMATNYRSIIDAKWQTWDGFTSALFGWHRNNRNYCKVVYHFDSSVKQVAVVKFGEEDIYWSSQPTLRAEIYIPCTKESDVKDLLNPNLYQRVLEKTDYNPKSQPELVIRKIIPQEKKSVAFAVDIQSYWLFDPKSAE